MDGVFYVFFSNLAKTRPVGLVGLGFQPMVSITTRGYPISSKIQKKSVITTRVVTDMSVLQTCWRRFVCFTPGPPRHCVARLLSTSRGDSTVANRVIKDIRQESFMESPRVK